MEGGYVDKAELWEMEAHIREKLGENAVEYLSLTVVGASPVCRECGCTNEEACPGGCSWIEPDLCSACVASDDEPDLAENPVTGWHHPREPEPEEAP